jgi:hypothetical protein
MSVSANNTEQVFKTVISCWSHATNGMAVLTGRMLG